MFLMQKMFSRLVQILETITQAKPLIHFRRQKDTNEGPNIRFLYSLTLTRLRQKLQRRLSVNQRQSSHNKHLSVSLKQFLLLLPQVIFFKHFLFIDATHSALSYFYCRHNNILLELEMFEKVIDNPVQWCPEIKP